MPEIKNYYEISEAPSPDGRRRVKVSLHEIHDDDSQYNLNGITYIEKYVRANGNSIVGMPLCAAFLDENKDAPYDHGRTGIDGAMPLFENSEQVGVADGWSVEDVEFDGEKHRVCMAVGYINQQRYPDFVKWLETKKSQNLPVYGSVEFVGTKENQEIIYDGGWKEKGRIPMEYVYSGYCFLTVQPSDDSARVIELNEKTKQEGEEMMTIEELAAKIDAMTEMFADYNACKSALEENEAKLVESNASVEQLTSALADAKAEIDKKYEEISTLYAECELLREETAKAKVAARVGEFNEAMKEFSDDEKSLASEEIEKFNADPMNVEINQVVEKIKSAAYTKLKEQHLAEINSKEKSFEAADIFANVDPVDPKDEVVDFKDMLG